MEGHQVPQVHIRQDVAVEDQEGLVTDRRLRVLQGPGGSQRDLLVSDSDLDPPRPSPLDCCPECLCQIRRRKDHVTHAVPYQEVEDVLDVRPVGDGK